MRRPRRPTAPPEGESLAYLRASRVAALADRLRRGESVGDGPEAEDARRLVAFSRAIDETPGMVPCAPEDAADQSTAADAAKEGVGDGKHER